MTRTLLAAAAPMTLAAALAACGHNTPAMRATSYPAPVTEASVVAPAPAPVIEAVVPVAAPVVPAAAAASYATPMCDENGRPLAGNVRSKRSAGTECEGTTQ
jgi:hypothetical protein